MLKYYRELSEDRSTTLIVEWNRSKRNATVRQRRTLFARDICHNGEVRGSINEQPVTGQMKEMLQDIRGVFDDDALGMMLAPYGDYPWGELFIRWTQRSLKNSDDCDDIYRICEWRISGTPDAPSQGDGGRIDNGTIHDEYLQILGCLPRLDPRTTEWKSLPTLEPGPLRCIVLAPKLAAILLHEVAGHAAELGPNYANQIVGTQDLNIHSLHPRRVGNDDEGTRIAPAQIVENGRLSDHIFSRQREAREGQPGARLLGVAQRSIHGAQTLPRCTHLKLTLGIRPCRDSLHFMSPYVCIDCAGATMTGTTVLLHDVTATRVNDGEARAKLPAFTLGWSFGRSTISAIGSDVERTPGGVCLVGSTNPLVTEGEFPSLFVTDITCMHSYHNNAYPIHVR